MWTCLQFLYAFPFSYTHIYSPFCAYVYFLSVSKSVAHAHVCALICNKREWSPDMHACLVYVHTLIHTHILTFSCIYTNIFKHIHPPFCAYILTFSCIYTHLFMHIYSPFHALHQETLTSPNPWDTYIVSSGPHHLHQKSANQQVLASARLLIHPPQK